MIFNVRRDCKQMKNTNANKLTIRNNVHDMCLCFVVSKYPKIVAKSGGWQQSKATTWWLAWTHWMNVRSQQAKQLLLSGIYDTNVVAMANRHFLFHSSTSVFDRFISSFRKNSVSRWMAALRVAGFALHMSIETVHNYHLSESLDALDLCHKGLQCQHIRYEWNKIEIEEDE